MATRSSKPVTPSTASNGPHFEAFVVTRRAEADKGFWTRVGAAWNHADGEGLTLRLVALPTEGELVLRKPRPESESSERPAKA